MFDNSHRPKQLENKRKAHYDKLYKRQPQLMKRLNPLLSKAEIIEKHTEPFLYSPDDPLSERLSEEPKINGKKLHKELSKFQPNKNPKKSKEPKRLTKVSQIRPDVLWGLK